jgi:hypothetical protein
MRGRWGSVAEPWLTKREVARELKVSTRTIERIKPPCTRVGGQNRYHLSEVEATLRGVPPEGGNVVRLPLDRMRGAAA